MYIAAYIALTSVKNNNNTPRTEEKIDRIAIPTPQCDVSCSHNPSVPITKPGSQSMHAGSPSWGAECRGGSLGNRSAVVVLSFNVAVLQHTSMYNDTQHNNTTTVNSCCCCSHINSHNQVRPWPQDRLQSLWSGGVPHGKKHKIKSYALPGCKRKQKKKTAMRIICSVPKKKKRK